MQVTVAEDVTDETNDTWHAQPMLTKFVATTGTVLRVVSMDTRHFSEVNVTVLTVLGCILLSLSNRYLVTRRFPLQCGADRSVRIVSRRSDVPYLPNHTRVTSLPLAQSNRRAGVRPEQAWPWQSFLLRGMR